MATFAPTSALSSVDLPAFGAPISATNPARVGSAAPGSGAVGSDGLTTIAGQPILSRRKRRGRKDVGRASRGAPYAFAAEHIGGGLVLGLALGAASAATGLELADRDLDLEFRRMVGA